MQVNLHLKNVKDSPALSRINPKASFQFPQKVYATDRER